MKQYLVAVALTALSLPLFAADTTPAELIAKYEQEAGVKADIQAGQSLFMDNHTGGKPDTPSCTSCHTKDPRAIGKLRTGKAVDPMVPSVNPKRFTDSAKVTKWFGRNCNSVLGRDCTAAEKANFIAWLDSL